MQQMCRNSFPIFRLRSRSTLAIASDVRTAKESWIRFAADTQKTKSRSAEEEAERLLYGHYGYGSSEDRLDAIAALPATPTVMTLSTIRSAEKAYNKLTDDQKAYLTQRAVNKLNAAVFHFCCLYGKVGYVYGLIAALPEDTVTAKGSDGVEAARAAYNNPDRSAEKSRSAIIPD